MARDVFPRIADREVIQAFLLGKPGTTATDELESTNNALLLRISGRAAYKILVIRDGSVRVVGWPDLVGGSFSGYKQRIVVATAQMLGLDDWQAVAHTEDDAELVGPLTLEAWRASQRE